MDGSSDSEEDHSSSCSWSLEKQSCRGEEDVYSAAKPPSLRMTQTTSASPTMMPDASSLRDENYTLDTAELAKIMGRPHHRARKKKSEGTNVASSEARNIIQSLKDKPRRLGNFKDDHPQDKQHPTRPRHRQQQQERRHNPMTQLERSGNRGRQSLPRPGAFPVAGPFPAEAGSGMMSSDQFTITGGITDDIMDDDTAHIDSNHNDDDHGFSAMEQAVPPPSSLLDFDGGSSSLLARAQIVEDSNVVRAEEIRDDDVNAQQKMDKRDGDGQTPWYRKRRRRLLLIGTFLLVAVIVALIVIVVVPFDDGTTSSPSQPARVPTSQPSLSPSLSPSSSPSSLPTWTLEELLRFVVLDASPETQEAILQNEDSPQSLALDFIAVNDTILRDGFRTADGREGFEQSDVERTYLHLVLQRFVIAIFYHLLPRSSFIWQPRSYIRQENFLRCLSNRLSAPTENAEMCLPPITSISTPPIPKPDDNNESNMTMTTTTNSSSETNVTLRVFEHSENPELCCAGTSLVVSTFDPAWLMDDLYIPSSNLNGTIPVEIGLLTSLQSLQLQDNAFHGTIPADAMRRLTSLQYLDLSNNSLTGWIPRDLLSLKNLTYVNLANNSFASDDPIMDVLVAPESLRELLPNIEEFLV